MPLKDYKLVKKIGGGGFGEAFLYVHKDRQQYVIKKIDVKKPDIKEMADLERDKMQQLKHEHIVLYKECFVVSGFMWLVMEYCSGGDLADEISASKIKNVYLDESQILKWTFQICLGLEYLHDNNVMHRDLKPQNIFLSAEKDVRIGDFGISRSLDAGHLATTCIGSPIYLSPEQIASMPYGNKIDVWALGCCVYEMMTWETAIDPIQLLRGQLLVRDMPKSYSTELTQLTSHMLTVDSDQRPSVKEILQNSLMTKQQQQKISSSRVSSLHNSLVSLNKMDLTFNNNGQLVSTKTRRLFDYEVHKDKSANEQRYQQVAKLATNFVQEVLEKDLKMQKVEIQIKSGRFTTLFPTAFSHDLQGYIFATADWTTNRDKLLVLVPGDGTPSPGIWSRKMLVNDCTDAGSQIPWVKRGVADKYAMLLLNPNLNRKRSSETNGNDTHSEHVSFVWEHFISKAPAQKVFIVAHGSGGRAVLNLACNRTTEFLSRVKAVAFTSSWHKVTKQMPTDLTDYLYQHCMHWNADRHDLDVPLSYEKYDAPVVSAGDRRPEWTTWSCFNSVFSFFNTQMS